jgi:hypothetical protein
MPVYAVEYSVKNDEYRVQPWDMMIQYNNDEVMAGRETGFTLIGIGTTKTDAAQLGKRHEKLMSQKLKSA